MARRNTTAPAATPMDATTDTSDTPLDALADAPADTPSADTRPQDPAMADDADNPIDGSTPYAYDPATDTYTPITAGALAALATAEAAAIVPRDATKEPPRDGGTYSFDPASGNYTRIG